MSATTKAMCGDFYHYGADVFPAFVLDPVSHELDLTQDMTVFFHRVRHILVGVPGLFLFRFQWM